MKNILIVDPNPISRKALALLIRSKMRNMCIYELDELQQVLDRVDAGEPDIILLDEALFEGAGSKVELPLNLSKSCVILMSVDDNKLQLANSIGAGFIHKATPPDRVVDIINSVNCQNMKGER